MKVPRIRDINNEKEVSAEIVARMLSILRKARLKDKEMRILMLWVAQSIACMAKD